MGGPLLLPRRSSDTNSEPAPTMGRPRESVSREGHQVTDGEDQCPWVMETGPEFLMGRRVREERCRAWEKDASEGRLGGQQTAETLR